jgi:hypothetical protein
MLTVQACAGMRGMAHQRLWRPEQALGAWSGRVEVVQNCASVRAWTYGMDTSAGLCKLGGHGPVDHRYCVCGSSVWQALGFVAQQSGGRSGLCRPEGMAWQRS